MWEQKERFSLKEPVGSAVNVALTLEVPDPGTAGPIEGYSVFLCFPAEFLNAISVPSS
jgi:hypothetical protein